MTDVLKAIPLEDYDPALHRLPVAFLPIAAGEAVQVLERWLSYWVFPASPDTGKFSGVALEAAAPGAGVKVATRIVGYATSPTTMIFKPMNDVLLLVIVEEANK